MAKLLKCEECKNFEGKNCTHKKNIGLKIKYKQQSEFYISKASDLNKDGKCEFYAKFSKK